MRKQMIGIALILFGIWAAIYAVHFESAEDWLSISIVLSALILPLVGLIWVIAYSGKGGE